MTPLNVKRFEDDLNAICDKLASSSETPREKKKLDDIRLYLVELYKRNLVKINHSVIELICAHYLLQQGYDVKVEYKLQQDLVCDVYGKKGDGNIIIEIETGFVPPAHALDPTAYCSARIISKTARYSVYSNKFVLGTVASYVLPIPAFLQYAPRFRSSEDVNKGKALCDIYYHNPPIRLDQITYSELHSIFVIEIDLPFIKEISAEVYLSAAKGLQFFKS
jgi:hypothetical protein